MLASIHIETIKGLSPEFVIHYRGEKMLKRKYKYNVRNDTPFVTGGKY